MVSSENLVLATDLQDSAQQLLQEKAVAMYSHLPNVLLFTFIATSALALYFQGAAGQMQLFLWWGCMQMVSLLRLVSLCYWLRLRRLQLSAPIFMVMIRWFSFGSLASGVIWAAFSVMYFYESSSSQRLVIALVMSTVAAGSITVLALMPWVNRLFIALLIVPLLAMFATTGAVNDLVIAGLGLALFIGLTGFARVSRDSALKLFVSARDSDRKIANAIAQRDELLLTKDDLEERLAQQIETLEFEVALKERYAEELARRASTDALTGLLNRSTFEQSFHQMIELARPRNAFVGLLVIEVLRFDVVELQGASIAEQVLLTLTDRLRSFIAPGSLVARWGDAEFALTILSREHLFLHEGSLLRTVLQQPVDTNAGAVAVDVMLGASVFPGSAQDAELLLYQASVAKHSLRQQGIGGIKLFDTSLDAGVKERQHLRQALVVALEAGDLALVFQPIEPCGDSQPRKLEALLRWDDSELGAVSPALFVPVAEECGLIVPIGRWVLDTACQMASQWPVGSIVCVNVSVHQILAGDLLGDVSAALAKSGLPVNQLEIEITESVFSHDLDYVCAVLEQLRALGVALAIDDFGTGYSSLAYLRRLPIDTIKIDRSFIQDIDQNAHKLLQAIVSMARDLGLRVVVEGIETEQQQDLLVAMGVDYLQGYLISRPLADADVAGWLIADETSCVSTH
jgi:diguanylate cyclase (GGDEF)-like protein